MDVPHNNKTTCPSEQRCLVIRYLAKRDTINAMAINNIKNNIIPN